MKYCPYCGAGLDQDMRFCPSCGKPFEGGKENPHLTGNEQKTEAAAPTPAPAPAGAEPVAPAPKKKRGGLIALIAVVVALAILGALFASGAFAPKEEPVVPFSDDPEAIAAASESVVMLTCYDKEGEPYATGSGFAVFDDGVIVTNYHVIQDEVYRVSAQTESGRSFDCPTVLAYDADRDIAILKADRETGLVLLPTGDSESLQKGEKVVAVGSPLGLINSVSTGVFSGYIDDEFGKMLQFTAAISHGSSGGALFNNAGEVIGITFASLSEGQSLNLGVPINEVKALYDYAGSQKPMSMEAFYDSFDHTPPIPTYTVGYVLEHYNELDGQTMYLEGYVSSIWGSIVLVDTESDVLGYVEDDYKDKAYFTYLHAWEAYVENEGSRIGKKSLSIEPPDDVDILDMITMLSEVDFDVAPGQKLQVLCLFEIKEKYNDEGKRIEGERLCFTPYEITLLEDNPAPNILTQTFPTYTVGYLLEHYEELDGQTINLEGYVSSIVVGNYYSESGLATTIYLVDRSADVYGVSYIEEKTSVHDASKLVKERNRVGEFKSIIFFLEGQSIDWIKPNDRILAQCKLDDLGEYSNGAKTWGAYRLSFTIDDITVIE